MFRSDSVPDDGFTARVVMRVRRQMWVRRLSLPVAFTIGAVFSAKPLLQIASIVPGLIESVFGGALSVDKLPLENLPSLSTMLFGATLAMALLLAGKLLEE
jgi:hypothetical protein